MTELALRCRCGAVEGVVTDVAPASCSHVICYCRDCRVFARFLGGDDFLDAHGGTEVVQVAPSQVRFTAGFDRLRSMRLSPKGLLRWYTDCCRTPIGNMISIKVPFVGLPSPCFVALPESAVGPKIGVNARTAPGGKIPPGAHAGAPVGFLFRVAKLMLGWWIGGKGRPSPYFDDAGVPRVAPVVIDLEERMRLQALVG
jgi:hypothetical protein